jgi:hypothetical protein
MLREVDRSNFQINTLKSVEILLQKQRIFRFKEEIRMMCWLNLCPLIRMIG